MKGKELFKEKKDDWSDLPQNLKKLTKAQSDKLVKFFVKKPLKELRKLQILIQQQIGKAFQQKNDEALDNLRIKERILEIAIDEKEFG